MLRILFLLLAFMVPAYAQTAQEVIAGADAIRNPDEGYRVTTTLTDYEGGRQRGQNVLHVYALPNHESGQFRNLVRYVEPPRDAGKVALLDGTNLWFYDPASKASVRISAQQRLIGQAAIGDVLTVNLAADYSGHIIGSETIQDAARQDRLCWHLDMDAANDRATYRRVEYWVEQKTFRPVKLKFYSDSGRMLKILYYRNWQSVLGRERPTEAIIIDAVDSTQVTLSTTTEYRAMTVPESWFQRDFLARLPPE